MSTWAGQVDTQGTGWLSPTRHGTHLPQVWAWHSRRKFRDMSAGHSPGWLALLTDALSQKLAKRARGILSREVPRRKGELPGRVKLRFPGAVTHLGPVCLYDTALAQCGRVYALTDTCGLAHELLVRLLAGLTAGWP